MVSITHAASPEEYKDGERVVPGKAPLYLFEKHASRYQFVRDIVKGKRLLDIGCGEGYGSFYLAQFAKSVVGIDIAAPLIERVQQRYRRPNLTFQVMDSTNLQFPASHFDVLCSFEMIEHIEQVDRFLESSARVLDPKGTFAVTTPNKYGYVATGHNPFHVTEYTLEEFDSLLRRHFSVVEIYGQFCQRPIRRRIYQTSSRLFFNSPLYQRLSFALAPLYFKAFWGKNTEERTDWIDRVKPNLFAFSRTNPERADSFLALCKK